MGLLFRAFGEDVLETNNGLNPFVPMAGSYAGLFTPISGTTFTNSVFFRATLTGKGAFSARLFLGGLVILHRAGFLQLASTPIPSAAKTRAHYQFN